MSCIKIKREQTKSLFEKLKNDPIKFQEAELKIKKFDAYTIFTSRVLERFYDPNNEKDIFELSSEVREENLRSREMFLKELEKTLLS